ncbi:MAG: type II secretion system F family protein [Schwartzia sp.]|nr:type II secretion system F family protein [Schwartzia sp. (in: firmicutes)]
MSASVMTEYDYKARDAEGRAVRGRLRAASRREAAKRITEGGLFVLRLRPARRRWMGTGTDRRFPVFLCRRLAVMLSAGVTVGEALRVLSEQDAAGRNGGIVSELFRAVTDGERLSEAMARLPQVFEPRMAALVDAGEQSGSLDVLLSRLADSLEADYAAREKLLTLMLYPCVLAFAVAAASVFLLAFVFPVFVSMFQSLAIELPLPTRLLLGVYGFLGDYGLWLLAAMILAAVAAGRLYRREPFRIRADRALLRLPVFGTLAASAERMRLAGTLSVLLSSGVVIDRALEILEGVTGNAFFRRELRRAHAEVQKGYRLSDTLRGGALLPPMLWELLATGEATGEMEMMLEKIASFCRLELDTGAERVRALLPPLALLLLGGAAGFIIFSAVLPLLDSMTAFM